MPRLSRAQTMAITREKLLTSAKKLYLELGYQPVSIEQIVEDSGYSRGAFYAHFASKEAIYLEVVKTSATPLLGDILNEIGKASSGEEAIEVICAWADKRLLEPDMSYLMVDVLRHAARNNTLGVDQMKPIRDNWRQLGEALKPFLNASLVGGDAEEIGCIIMLQIADGTFVEAIGGPATSRLLRSTLQAFLTR